MRAVLHRGYVLTSGLYFVISARLSASQIVFLGAAMSVTLTLSDIPAGAWADAVSRKWPLVAGHGFLAAGMVLTGIVTAFPLILFTQVLWGLGWAFSGGADVAWLTDELGQPGRIARVLAARARWDLTGGAAGLIAFGLLGWAAGLAVAIVVSGAAMALLGALVAARFTEDNFAPVPGHRWAASVSVFRRGLAVARQDREILLILAPTMAINGAGMVGWLFPRRLVGLGLPGGPVLGYTVVAILSSAAGVFALRSAEAWIDRAGAARRIYALTCFTGMSGLVVLARAPNAPHRRRRSAARQRHRLQRHQGGQRHLGEPAHHERHQGDGSLLPFSGRDHRRNHRRHHARRGRPDRGHLGSAHELGRLHRVPRRDGRRDHSFPATSGPVMRAGSGAALG
jgi:MFS family permease